MVKRRIKMTTLQMVIGLIAIVFIYFLGQVICVVKLINEGESDYATVIMFTFAVLNLVVIILSYDAYLQVLGLGGL
jgi:hypothetical protein